MLDYFGMNEGTGALSCNGDKDRKEEGGDEEELGKEAAISKGKVKAHELRQQLKKMQSGKQGPDQK